MRRFANGLLLLVMTQPAWAGLYYSGEAYADLPAQWRGFLLDQRALRTIAAPVVTGGVDGPLRLKYREAARKLEAGPLTADGKADLGAIYLRLGEVDRAVTLLRAAQREHPNHFAINANLGTAWQLKGDLGAAADALQQAVRLAPGKWLAAEELHLRLVRHRQRGGREPFDDLFGVRFVDERGGFTPGKLADAERKKLPMRAVALAQQLALWLPNDGPLLWQLGELANAHGDVRNAASLFEGCVVQFRMNAPELRRRRQLLKEAIDELPKLAVGDKAGHQEHRGTLTFRSRRPLASALDDLPLPEVKTDGVNAVPWEVFGATRHEGKFPPGFSRYLKELQGRVVTLTGFMQPLRDELELGDFLFIEFPVGCWFCEMPDLTGILHVEMADGTAAMFQRGLLRVTGRLTLNDRDPEDFLFTLRDARVAPVD